MEIYQNDRTQYIEEIIEAVYRTLDKSLNAGQLVIQEDQLIYERSKLAEYIFYNSIIDRSLHRLNTDQTGDIHIADTPLRYRENFDELIAEHIRVNDELVKDPRRLTPDIFLWKENGLGGYDYYIGDVAVTNNVSTVKFEKKDKYIFWVNAANTNPDRGFFVNFIVDANHDNFEEIYTQLPSSHMFRMDAKWKNTLYHYIEKIKKAVNTLRLKKLDPNERFVDVNVVNLRSDRLNPKFEAISEYMDNCWDKDESDDFEYVPNRSEEEVVKMITDEVKRIEGEYFEKDFDKSIAEFERIIQENDQREHTRPKPTMHCVCNTSDIEVKTGYDLVEEYIIDIMNSFDENSKGLIVALPTLNQLYAMKTCYKKYKDDKKYLKSDEFKENKKKGVHGLWSYDTVSSDYSETAQEIKRVLTKGKSSNNSKKSVKAIPTSEHNNCIQTIESMIEYLGRKSKKPDIFTDEWHTKSELEINSSTEMREFFLKVKCTNGVQLAQSLDYLYQRIIHMSASDSKRNVLFVPPNGSFVCVLFKGHAPTSDSQCKIKAIFICRQSDNGNAEIQPLCGESWFNFNSGQYKYHVSKMTSMDLNKISNWDQSAYRIVATSTALLEMYSFKEKEELDKIILRTVGVISILTLDIHQKTSELLELMKYLAFIPFAQLARPSTMIADKMNIMMKTSLDIWLFYNIQDFMTRLNVVEYVLGQKRPIKMSIKTIKDESFGLNSQMPSFIHPNLTHVGKTGDGMAIYVEEVSAVFTVRGKQLYGSQFMDKSMTQIAERTKKFEEESLESNWSLIGHDEKPYPFSNKFAFSSDAIHYATKFAESTVSEQMRIANFLAREDYNSYSHYFCNLRGSMKEPNKRSGGNSSIDKQYHTTSLDACLEWYKDHDYKENMCKQEFMTDKFLEGQYVPEFSMSEKLQRGGGRPIATPTLLTKCALRTVEIPEAAIGHVFKNNILVTGKDKLKEQQYAYETAIEEASREPEIYKKVYQCTEDQSKWSEEDNLRKYTPYFQTSGIYPKPFRCLQNKIITKISNRFHYSKRIPISVKEDETLNKYVRENESMIFTNIGWPQGMLNNLSTTIHQYADLWITDTFNIAYEKNVIVKGLVHSDDSWFVICCDSVETLEKYCLYRSVAKKLFCMKINDKKTYVSGLIGEMVSNFCINGFMKSPIIKIIANSTTNLVFQNWVNDATSVVSTLQQSYRKGATVSQLILLYTLLRDQLYRTHNVKMRQFNLHLLPVELGGFPDCSVFTLAVNGMDAHYYELYERYTDDASESDELKIVLSCISETESSSEVFGDDIHSVDTLRDDVITVKLPGRGEIFKCVKNVMPRSKKVARTIKSIEALPYEASELAMLITRPRSLTKSLGNLKAQTQNLTYNLAAQGYTQSEKRLAQNQALRASNEQVVLSYVNNEEQGSDPKRKVMSFNECHRYLLATVPRKISIKEKKDHFMSESKEVELCKNIVNFGVKVTQRKKTVSVVNAQPKTINNFSFNTPVKDILLYIIYKKTGNEEVLDYMKTSASSELLITDSKLALMKFSQVFRVHGWVKGSVLIYMMSMEMSKKRLWVQPRLCTDTQVDFLLSLFGNSISQEYNYSIDVSIYSQKEETSFNERMIKDLQTLLMLNKIYPGKFEPDSVLCQGSNDMTVKEFIKSVDYTSFDDETIKQYAVVHFNYVNDIELVRSIAARVAYTQVYKVRQARDTHGNYSGRYELLVTSRNKQYMFVGNGYDDNTFITNEVNVLNIIHTMREMVTRNFRELSYNNDQQFNIQKFWTVTHNSRILEQITPNKQLIRMHAKVVNYDFSTKSMPVDWMKGLVYCYQSKRVHDMIVKVDDITNVQLGRMGRELVTIDTNNQTQRIFACKQAFQNKMHSYIDLKPEYVDTLLNKSLYYSGVMVKLAKGKAETITENEARIALEMSLTSSRTGDEIINILLTIVRKRFQSDVVDWWDMEPGDIEVEVINLDEDEIELVDLASRSEGDAVINPDDLVIEMSEVMQTQRKGEDYRLMKYSNIKQAVLQSISMKLSDTESRDCLIHLLRSGSGRYSIKRINEIATKLVGEFGDVASDRSILASEVLSDIKNNLENIDAHIDVAGFRRSFQLNMFCSLNIMPAITKETRETILQELRSRDQSMLSNTATVRKAESILRHWDVVLNQLEDIYGYGSEEDFGM
ncbi:RNA-directed RNA polymerase [Scaphoideus titanus bunya-like virus 1]|uniref:RNA-directed RNA polymerase L n=1 Tax=Scaphoideus titanus bunya-like virus 1 TaxID=2716551 RepID=A0A6G7NRS1_9VIRU|nr:RNA-directed RNA polymerase [Scaphoideus titanus bunya-like virus 1]QIJ56910.1 RNA-directed RNA polymerase [Scaphoideus titanus bunya-like virus 1]